jgi:hypothetical protein
MNLIHLSQTFQKSTTVFDKNCFLRSIEYNLLKAYLIIWLDLHERTGLTNVINLMQIAALALNNNHSLTKINAYIKYSNAVYKYNTYSTL